MSAATTNQNQGSTPNPAVGSGQNNGSLPYGKGDEAYAPALVYAMVAKLMGKELELSNTLKQIQSDETQESMKAAANQASETRSSAFDDAIGQDVAGSLSIAQGGVSLGTEAYLTSSQSKLRGEQHTLESKLSTINANEGASSTPQANKESIKAEKEKLNKQIEEKKDKHMEITGRKETLQSVISGAGQFSQSVAKAGTGISKSSHDARTSLDQTYQQSYKQVADEMAEANQTAMSTINQFTSENFAAATAIRG